MKFNLDSLAVCLGFAGSMVFAYGVISKGLETSGRLTSAYLGSNPFALKDLYYAKWEAIFGSALLALAFLATLATKQFPDFGINYPRTRFAPALDILGSIFFVSFISARRRRCSRPYCIPQGQIISFDASD